MRAPILTMPSRRAHPRLIAAVAAALLIASSLGVAGVSAASATLRAPSQASPGQTVTVSGSGFRAGQAGYLTFNGAKGVSFAASSAGAFSVPFAIPGSARIGTGRISARSSSGGLLATTTLAIVTAGTIPTATPKPTSSPTLTPAPTASATPRPSATSSATPRPSPTPVPSVSTPSPSPSPSLTPAPSATASPSRTPAPTPTTSASATSGTTFPIRAAFYYPWFPEAWNQSGIYPFTHYHPSAGFYSESDVATVAAQIRAMQYGKISVGIASWWGRGTREDVRMPLLLSTAAGTGFRWSIYYEAEGQSDPTATQIAADLSYIATTYGSDPSFLRIGGKPVVFVYAQPADACSMAARWAQANASHDVYVVLKVFAGYSTCASQPDQWHQYGPATAADDQRGHSYAISPGFWLETDAAPRLARDLTRWKQNVRDMVASGEPFQLITTFNEWGEGTSVESATEWASASGYGAYLDALHTDGQ